MSPVRNQPSTKAALVASGSFSYPSNTSGPRTQISPVSPQATSRPLSLRIATSTFDGSPDERGGARCGGIGACAMLPVSVIP